MFIPEEGVRYDIPVVFGPSPVPPVSTVDDVRSMSVAFRTDPERLAELVPHHFGAPADPVVTVSSRVNSGVSWLAGREYRLLAVSFNVAARDQDGSIFEAPYAAVAWENDPAPVIAGREYQGYQKLYGEVHVEHLDNGRRRSEVSEYGTTMIRLEAAGLVPIPADELERLGSNTRTAGVGWKYVTGPGNVVDVDYPTKVISYRQVSELSKGTGSVEFMSVDAASCPTSMRVIETLRRLPILEIVGATVATMSSSLPRSEATRIRSMDLATRQSPRDATP